jgi:outer membrane protein assembly factor BamB
MVRPVLRGPLAWFEMSHDKWSFLLIALLPTGLYLMNPPCQVSDRMKLRSFASSHMGAIVGSVRSICRWWSPGHSIWLWLALSGCLLLAPAAQAQWAFGVGGTNWESGQALAVTSNDEVVVTGWSTPEADWDPSETAEVFLGAGAGFVARYRADGSLVWARGLHGIAYGVAIDDAGDIFVVNHGCELRKFSPDGDERWAVEIEPPPQSCRHVAVAGSGFLYVGGDHAYLARVNPENGEVLWSHRLGSGSDTVEGLTAHASGAVTMTGKFYSAFDSDPGSGEDVLAVDGPPDLFLASYDPEGDHRWAVALSASEFENIGRAVADETGAVYTTGNFAGTMDFGSGLVQGEGRASFVVKYDSSGTHAWTRTSGGSGSGRSISVNMGLVAAAGNYQGINFHPERLPSEELTGRGIYVAQFDTAGTYHWIRGLPSFDSVPWTIGLDSRGAMYLSGLLWGVIDFDPGPGVFEVRNWEMNGHFSDLGNFFLARSGPGGTFSVGSDREQPALPSSVSLAAPYPHPVRGQAIFELRVDRPQLIKLVLTDLLGRRVRVIADRHFQAATHALRVDLFGLPAGLYVAHVRGQHGVSRAIVIQ